MSWLEVIHPGVQSSVQDSGRRGYRHHGLAAGGALDLISFTWANKLLDNPRHAGCLEIMLGGFRAIAHGALQIAITGARTSVTVNGEPLELWRTFNLNDGDELIGVAITHGDDDIMLFSDAGKVVRFNEKLRDSETGAVKLDPETGEELLALRPMGRTATGVRGIKMPDGQKVVSLIVPRGDGAVLTATENGYGKRTPLEDYPAKSRATQGVVSIKVSDRNGKVVGAVQVDENDEIMLISNAGTLVRTRVSEVSTVGRNTQGVRLIRTGENEQLVALQRIEEIEDAELIEAEGDEAEAVDTNAAQDGADESTTDE